MTHSSNLFVDVHVLQTVPPSLINRDDTGSPKSAVYGGVTRSRVSSQAWKRATRREFNDHLNLDELGERTLRVVERIAKRIRNLDSEIDEATARKSAEDVLTATKIKVKAVKPKADAEDQTVLQNTGYLVFLSRAQINALADLALRGIAGESITKSKAQKALTDGNSVDVALFGRMIADAPELNVDAACQVAHAISVHEAVTEYDYFTAVDDNAPEDNAGAGMIGTVEFTSSTLYRYATIDVKRLAENLGSEEAALRAIEAFTRSFVVSMPTGKQNTFANRTRPGFVMLEVRNDQPVNLVGAFENPIRSTSGVLPQAAQELARFAVAGEVAYGSKPVRREVVVADPNAEEAVAAFEGAVNEDNFEDAVKATIEAVRTTLAGDR